MIRDFKVDSNYFYYRYNQSLENAKRKGRPLRKGPDRELKISIECHLIYMIMQHCVYER
jgi:hypothetical protein